MLKFLDGDRVTFPKVKNADTLGLLAVGGNLTTINLIKAYAHGIFPWYNDDTPVLWWSPDPRLVLFPDEFRISKSLRQTIRNKAFEVRFDCNFESVIRHCAAIPRSGQEGTWITEEMISAYIELYHFGYAHSVEAYLSGRLAGGLYGVSLGRAFFGESMFFLERDASKVAMYTLVQRLVSWNFHFIDAQQETNHLKRFGARPVRRQEFIEMLDKTTRFQTIRGKW